MLDLLKILNYIYVNKTDGKGADYRKGFTDCLELLRLHLLKTGIINEIVILKRRIELITIAKDTEYKLILKKTKEYKNNINDLNNRISSQRQMLDRYERKIAGRKDRDAEFRRRIITIINSSLIPEEDKLKIISNHLKSYNDGQHERKS